MKKMKNNSLQIELERQRKEFKKVINDAMCFVEAQTGESPREKIEENFVSCQQAIVKKIVEMIKNHEFKMDIKKYLPMVKKWTTGYDIPFDDGYNQFRKDILSALNENK